MYFTAREHFHDFRYLFLDVVFTCWQIWWKSRPQLALNGRCPQHGYVLSWHHSCSPLPPLLKLHARVDCFVLRTTENNPQLLPSSYFFFFYSNLHCKLYSPKIDLERGKKGKKKKKRRTTILYITGMQLFREDRRDRKSAVKTLCVWLGHINAPNSFPSLSPSHSFHKVCILFIDWLYFRERRALSLTPSPCNPRSWRRRSKRGRRQNGCITSWLCSCPDLQQPDLPLKFSTPRLEVRSITEEQQGQRICCFTCSHFPTIGAASSTAARDHHFPYAPPCHHSENTQPPPQALRLA